MSKKGNVANVEAIERRRHWRDRRAGSDRRNTARLNLSEYDARTGQVRRTADIAGSLADGEIWWNKSATQFE